MSNCYEYENNKGMSYWYLLVIMKITNTFILITEYANYKGVSFSYILIWKLQAHG